MAGRRSWVDALFDLVDRIPGPTWLVYAALTLLFGTSSVLLRLLDGSAAVTPINPATTAYAAFTVLPFAVAHYLSRAAVSSLEEFRPALGDLEPRYAEFRRRLTTMPIWVSIVAPVLGLAVWATGQLSSRSGWGITAHTSTLTNVTTIATGIVLNVGLAILVARCLRQAVAISRLHRDATAIRLGETGPHVAFSRLTFAMAISVAVPYSLVLVLTILLSEISITEVVIYVVVVALVVALFVLPLGGLHGRLLRLKAARLSESNRVFELAGADLHRTVESGDLARVPLLNDAIAALGAEQERIRRFSTWPWSAETIRGLLTSLGLPVLLWLITTLLGRLLA